MPIKHSFVSAKSDGADSSVVRPSDWNADHTIDGTLTMDSTTAPAAVSTKGQLYVKTASGVTKLYFKGDDGTEHGPFQGSTSGSNTGDQTITLTGDVTGSGTGSFAATIANSAVTNAKVATGIGADKIADGSVSNTEFQYLDGVTSAIQTQLNAKGTFTLPSLTSGSVLFSNGTTIAQDNSNLFFDDTNNRLGVGTASPSTTVHAIATTEQLRVGYDTNNYYKTTVGSTGAVTLDAVGSGAKFTFSDAVEVPDDAYASGWNGSTQVPTKNAVYDKLELMKPESFIIACSDETTALTTGTAKVKFRMPYAFTVTAVRASLSTAQASGNIFTVDINEHPNGGSLNSILGTKLTIDNTETTSTTAATAATITDSSLADDAEISVDIDQIGTSGAKGLKVVIIGYKS